MYYSGIDFASDKKHFGKIVIYSSLKTTFFYEGLHREREREFEKRAFYSAIL